jgi:hypothetical protein
LKINLTLFADYEVNGQQLPHIPDEPSSYGTGKLGNSR